MPVSVKVKKKKIIFGKPDKMLEETENLIKEQKSRLVELKKKIENIDSFQLSSLKSDIAMLSNPKRKSFLMVKNTSLDSVNSQTKEDQSINNIEKVILIHNLFISDISNQ